MKHAYLLLLTAGLFAMGCKKNNTGPDELKAPKVARNWMQDGSLINPSPGYQLYRFGLGQNMRYYIEGGIGPEKESGTYAVRATARPDSCVLIMMPDNGSTHIVPAKVQPSGHMNFQGYGDFYHSED